MCEEESCITIKRICNANNNVLKEHCVATTENITLHEDSILLSVTGDFTDDSFLENEACDKAPFEKVNKKVNNQVKTKLDTSQNARNTIVSKVIDKDRVLKETQDLNTTALKSSFAELPSCKEDALHNLKKTESSQDFSTIDEDEFDSFFDQECHVQINFTTLQRCKIIDIKHELKITVLTVQHIESENTDVVACSGFWKDVQVKIDDIVMIQAKKGPQQWIIDNNNGFLVTNPDMLISGTTITSGLFCNRRAVLTDKFRKIESLPSLNADYSVMTVGSLVHQWLQKALRENICALSDVIKLLDDMLQSKSTIDYLYSSELSLADCRKRMMEYAPRIFEFIQHYIKDNEQQRIRDLKNNFQGKICNIQDIEESVYIPKLGIKGRIDVTAEVNINSRRKIMPLEVKTGRASYSLEHKGQVILYLMMMGSRDQDIDTGLLLYLKENAMQEIKSSHHEKRDLILLRNTLVHYFSKKPEDHNVDSQSDLKTMELPEPINHPACTRCPYQTLCCAYLTKDPNVNLSQSHQLTLPMTQLLNDFESSHLDYVMTWIALLQLEEAYENVNSLSNVWTMSAEKREARGTCICNLKIVGEVVMEQDDRYRHKFARVNIKGETIDDGTFSSSFTEDNYVIISTDAKINIAAGHIMHVSHDTVTVLLDKDVTRQNADSTFHIDKYSSSTGLSTFNYANVAGLLSNDDESIVKLRCIVIDRIPATFAEKLPRSIVSASAKIISDLNENQQRAVLKALAANEYILIKGMPGTGKTQTLVALIELLQTLGSSVLITAHTHSAVDNLLLKLLERNIDFLRLGSTKQIHPLLTCKSEEYALASCDSPESLETLYNSKQIVGVTCLGAYHALLRRRTFDVCVVDESAQIMQPTVLRPLYSTRKFILVGDPDQLPPIVKNKTAARLGADESLFTRLDSDNNTVNLLKQYRMNGRIMRLANDVTYHGKLEPANKQVENATLTGTNMEEMLSSCEGWIRSALSRNVDDSVVVLDTGNTYNLSVESVNRNDQVYSNVWEAAVILRLVQALAKAGVCGRNIGVIAPYNAQINLLKKILDKEVEVNTVDQYQGRDKDVILYSCTKSTECNTKKEFEILDDQRRLTVAITRARHKLVIISDKMTLTRYTPFKNLFDVIDEKNVISLHNGEADFNWESLVSKIDNSNNDKEIKE
ncbi:DNA2-like helicase [Camponotus floridanus]|uniref:DNA replication ATP-dependent helicase/nuclease n=2 Tax=Camponotus floridanus TaxID=104421 RepID=E2A0A1_CAMFO|nr:DNA2-like helicase [Camponotus floridanus]